MTTLTDVQIGSIVSGMISNIPVGISGLLTTIVDNQVYFAQTLTGVTISVSSIPEVYQPGITSLSIANVLKLMEAQGIGTSSVKIGELSITKGMSQGTSKEWKEWGIEQLNTGGEVISYYQCWG